jgi:hypothetical protein
MRDTHAERTEVEELHEVRGSPTPTAWEEHVQPHHTPPVLLGHYAAPSWAAAMVAATAAPTGVTLRR